MLKQAHSYSEPFVLKWSGWVNDALKNLDKTTGTWINLPCAGGYYNQDMQIMEIWEAVSHAYFSVLSDKNFKEALKRKYGNGTA